MSRKILLPILIAAVATLSGCGFIAAGQKSHSKPTAFVLIGHAAVVLASGDHRAAGTPCDASAGITDLGAGTPVKVIGASGDPIAYGTLGSGTVDRAGTTPTCDFPFQIRDVPGGSDTYGVAVGNRSAHSFPAADLRRNTAAVITITS